MPDIPTTVEQDTAADRKSKPYRDHPSCTVRQFCKLKYAEQRLIDRQCEELQGGTRRWVSTTREKAAHWLVKDGKQWIEQAPI